MNSNNLFYQFSQGSIEISHSFINHSGFTMTGVNNSLTGTQTYKLFFYHSHYCNADNKIPLVTPQSTLVNTPRKTPLKSPEKTIEATIIDTPQLSPIITPKVSPIATTIERTLIETMTIKQSPFETPHNTIAMTNKESPIMTPYRSYEEIVPHTPYDTHHPGRTNERSFPLDYNERTSNESDNNDDQNKANSLFIYSTAVLSLILICCFILIINKIKISEGASSSTISLNQST